MSFVELTKKEFQRHTSSVSYKSFMQSLEMEELYRKRGYSTKFVGFKENDEIVISAILYSLPMTGGLLMEINSGPCHNDASYLKPFYEGLKEYAKQNGALELLVKPYDTYQTFDTNGEPIDEERPELIKDLTDLGYSHDGLQTGYPGGEPDWHYVKNLTDLDKDSLFKSYSKKGRPLVKKARTFGIKLRRLERDELHIFKEITSSTSNRRQYDDKSLDYYEALYDSFGNSADFMIATLNFQDYYNNIKLGEEKVKKQLDKVLKNIDNNPNSVKSKNQLNELNRQIQTFEDRLSEAEELMNRYQDEDVTLSGALFIYTRQEAYYLFSGSYTEFNKFYSPALLQEYAMEKAIELEIPTYNFLGITGEFDNSDGVLRFKQNFNGYITRKTGTFRYYPKPTKYKIIQLIKKLLRRI